MRLRRLLLALAAAFTIATGSRAAGAARPMNFVFILIDDLGWADVGCFGSKFYETPHVDRLASQGVRVTDGYAACAVCSQTRASIMTGKYPARLHITDWIPGEGTPKNSINTDFFSTICELAGLDAGSNALDLKPEELGTPRPTSGAPTDVCRIPSRR